MTSFPRFLRVPSSGIPFLFKKGKKVRCNTSTLVFAKNHEGKCRISVIVSSKVSAKSTARNRLKRRARDCIRSLFPRMAENCDMIFMFYKNISTKKEIQVSVERLLICAHLI